MTVLDIENVDDVTTEHWSFGTSQADQSNPVTRRIAFDGHLSDLETRAIERNAEFHSTIVGRLKDAKPRLIESDEVLDE